MLLQPMILCLGMKMGDTVLHLALSGHLEQEISLDMLFGMLQQCGSPIPTTGAVPHPDIP